MSDPTNDIITMDSLETGLKVISVFSTGFFAGGTAFIAYAFEPGVMAISNHCGLVSIRAALPRSKPLPLSIAAGTLASAGLYAISVKQDRSDMGWLVGAGILASVIPAALAFVGPLNRRIMNEELPEDDAPEEMCKWRFHTILRSAVVGGLFTYYICKLVK